MYDTSSTTPPSPRATGLLNGSTRFQQPLPDLRGLSLLEYHNVEPQTQTSMTGKGDDSSSRSPSRETEITILPILSPAKVSSVVLQKWEGFVLEIGAETFWARLTALVGEEGDQIAEIFLDEIDAEDQALLAPGSVFYWSIGYLDKPSGRERFSQIRLRRLPLWLATELSAAEKKAVELGELINGALVQ